MFTRRLWTALLLVTLLATFIPLASAQEPDAEVIARVDQAMAHLSTFLNGTSVSRLTNFWTFEQRTFADSSYGCPAPDVAYTQQTTEGYFIQITVNGIDYDYHTNRDGTILILCYLGLPHPSSLGIETSTGGTTAQPATTPLPQAESFNLPTSAWYVVVFNQTTDTLHWLNDTGEQASIPRPKLPDETEFSSPKVQFSRDGRVLVVAATLTSGSVGVGFYDLEMGWWLKTHVASRQELIELGGRFSSSADGRQMALGLYTVSATPNWRVIAFDLTTGDALYQFKSVDEEAEAFIEETLDPTQVYRPAVSYYDIDEVTQTPIIHVQYVPIGTIPPDVPTLAWYPNGIPGLVDQTLTPSPYQRRGIDFNPADGLAIFPYLDPTATVLETGNPSTQFNAVAVGSPLALAGYPGPFPRFTSATLGIGTTRWAANGQTILFQAINDQFITDWYATPDGITANPVRPPAQDVLGLPTGYLIFGQDGDIYTDTGDPLFEGTGLNLQVAWGSLAESPFGLTRVVSDTGLFYEPRPVPEGPVGPVETLAPDVTEVDDTPAGTSLCPGAPVSQVAVGSLAIVSFAGIPLNVRDVPGGNRIAQLNDGTAMTVNGGPQCQGVYTWWRILVSDTGVSGWVAEGDLTRYYIEPNPRFQPR